MCGRKRLISVTGSAAPSLVLTVLGMRRDSGHGEGMLWVWYLLIDECGQVGVEGCEAEEACRLQILRLYWCWGLQGPLPC